MILNIQDNECWVRAPGCTKKLNVTRHHAIPQHLAPKHNVILPICRNCHDKMHLNDSTLEAFAYKLYKQTQNLVDSVKKHKKEVKDD